MKNIIKAVVVLLFLCLTGVAVAQERNDVIKVYNEGAKAIQTDVNAAIQAFENVIVLSEKVGESVNDLKQKAMQVLPGLYTKVAAAAYNEKKPASEVIAAAKKAMAAAEKYNNATQKENARNILLRGYYQMGTELFAQKNYADALLTFDSILTINPDYVTAIYNKALIYAAQNSSDDFEKTIDLFLQKVKAQNDEEKIKQASELALGYFRAAGSQANQAGNLDEALSLLDKAARYGDDKDLFYFYADVYNKKKNFDKAAEFARKGLELETGDAEAKAKYYFQLGLAQSGKGQVSEACASFKNAAYGVFVQAANAERKNLKCQ
ncbi:MAG: tetratricopeptide repeat protein [Bacteroidales bacterium]